LNDVKKILRSSGREGVRFSENAFKRVTVEMRADVAAGNQFRNNQKGATDFVGGFNWAVLTYASSLAGRVQLQIVFSSPTDFDVYHNRWTLDGYDERQILYGSGSIGASFDYQGLITIPSTAWIGTFQRGSVVKIDFEVDISNDDAEYFLENTEIDIDNMCAGGRLHYLQPGEDRLFVSPDIPPAIKMVAEFLSAYYIYSGVFASEVADKTGNGQAHFSERWKATALRTLATYIAHKTRLPPSTRAIGDKLQDNMLTLVREWNTRRMLSPCDFKKIYPCPDTCLTEDPDHG
jgi:hypothetical protein